MYLERKRAESTTKSENSASSKPVTQQELHKEALRYVNMKRVSEMIQRGDTSTVSAIQKRRVEG
jgi:hypothetical protein